MSDQFWINLAGGGQPEEEPAKKTRSLSDRLSDLFDANIANYNTVTGTRNIVGDIKDSYNPLLYAIQEDQQRAERKRQIAEKEQELEENQRRYQEAHQRLVNDDSILQRLDQMGGTAQGMLTQLGGSVGGAVLGGVAGGLPGAAVGWKVGGGVGAVGSAGLDAASVADEAFLDVYRQTGDIDKANEVWDATMKKALLTTAPETAADIILNARVGNSLINSSLGKKFIGERGRDAITGIGNAVNKIGSVAPDIPSSIATKIASKGHRYLGKAAGVLSDMAIQGATEAGQEVTQDYIANRETARAMGQPDTEYSLGGWYDYATSPEGIETMKTAGFTGALFGGLGGAVSSGKYLGNGYHDSKATELAKVVAKGIENGEININSGQLDTIKQRLENIYDIDTKDMSVEDVVRNALAVQNDTLGTSGNEGTTVVNANHIINELIGESTNRRDYSTETSRNVLRNYDLEKYLDQNRASMEKQQTAAQEIVEKAKNNAKEQNKEGTTIKGSPDFIESVKNDDGTPISQKIKQQGTTEPTSPAQSTSWQNRFRARFSALDEGTPSENSVTFNIAGRKIRVDKNDSGSFSIFDNAKYGDTAVIKDTEDEAFSFLEDIERDRAEHGGHRFMAKALPEGDGAVADKDKFDGKIISEKNTPLIHNEKEFLDWYAKEVKGTDLERYLSRGDAYEIASILGNFNLGDTGSALAFHLGEKPVDYSTGKTVNAYGLNDLGFRDSQGRALGNPDIEQLTKEGVKNAIIRLYSGADAMTALHEIGHIGYWQMNNSERQVFGSWAIQTMNQFVEDILTSMGYEGTLREKAMAAIKDPNIRTQGIFEEVRFLLNYPDLDINNLNNLPADVRGSIQVAIEERFAWEFSMWYAEGYTKGVEPKGIIQRILNRICHSLRQVLGMVSGTSERLKSDNYQKVKHNGKDIRYNANATFENMNLNSRQPQVTETQETQQEEQAPQQQTEEEPMYAEEGANLSGVDTTQQGQQFNETPQQGQTWGTTRKVNQSLLQQIQNMSDEKLLDTINRMTPNTTPATANALLFEATRRGLLNQNRNNPLPINPDQGLFQRVQQDRLAMRNPIDRTGWDQETNQEPVNEDVRDIPTAESELMRRIISGEQPKEAQPQQQPQIPQQEENYIPSTEEELGNEIFNNILGEMARRNNQQQPTVQKEQPKQETKEETKPQEQTQPEKQAAQTQSSWAQVPDRIAKQLYNKVLNGDERAKRHWDRLPNEQKERIIAETNAKEDQVLQQPKQQPQEQPVQKEQPKQQEEPQYEETQEEQPQEEVEEPKERAKAILGKKVSAYTDANKEVNVTYAIMDLNDIVASTINDNGRFITNPKYPRQYQPRNRNSVVSETQVRRISTEMIPKLLAADNKVNSGAPVVLGNGVVINGNARTLSITEVYNDKRLADNKKKYQAYLKENAAEFGLKPQDLNKVQKPVLVRILENEADAQSVSESFAGGAVLGAAEQAKVDGKRITNSTLNKFNSDVLNPYESNANHNFVINAIEDITRNNPERLGEFLSAGTGEEGDTRNGKVTKDGIELIKRALFARAYGDDSLLVSMAEINEDDAKNVLTAMINAAPVICSVQAKMEQGLAYNYDNFTKELVDAVKRFNRLKRLGQTITQFLAENDTALFAREEVSPEEHEHLENLEAMKRSAKQITEYLKEYANGVIEQGNPNQADLKGNFKEKTPLVELAKEAREKVSPRQVDMFAALEEPQEAVKSEKPKAQKQEKQTKRKEPIKQEVKETPQQQTQQEEELTTTPRQVDMFADFGQVQNDETNETRSGNIENTNEANNQDRGGNENGETEKPRGTEDIRRTSGEVQGQQTGNGNDKRTVQQPERQVKLESDENNVRLDRRVSRRFNGLFKKLNLSTNLNDWFDVSKGKNQKENFIKSIKTAQENNEHGAAVDAPSVEDLDGAVIILHKSGQAGFYIKNGDFKGVFKDPNLKVKGISEDMTILARELGAVKCDCYGLPLVRLYARAGFVPVARLKFNEYYMDKSDPKNKFLLEEQPYVYALTVDTKDSTKFHKNLKDGVYGQNFSNQVLDTADDVVEIQDHDTAVRLGENENGEKYIRDLDELSEQETEELKKELSKYNFWDGKDLWYGGYSELLNHRDDELNKMPNKEKSDRDRSKGKTLTEEESLLAYVKKKAGEKYDEEDAIAGLEDAAALMDDLEYYEEASNKKDDKLPVAQKIFEKVIEDKPSNYVAEFIDKIVNSRKNTKDAHDLSFLLAAEQKFKQFKNNLGKPTKETEERVKHKVEVIYDKIFYPYLFNRKHEDTIYSEEENIKEDKKKKPNVYANEHSVSVRYMKATEHDKDTIRELNKSYNDEFFKIGRKLGYSNDEIKGVLAAPRIIEKVLNGLNSEKKFQLYLNPKDEQMYGKQIKAFAKLNHQVNEKLWARRKDKNDKLFYGKNYYKSPDGTWKREISDRNAKLNSDKIVSDILSNGRLSGLSYKLGDILSHKEVLDHFPKLKNLDVRFFDKDMVTDGLIKGITVDDLGFTAAYDPINKQIVIDSEKFNFFFDEDNLKTKEDYEKAINGIKEAIDDMLPFLLHEIQHAIQDIELEYNPSNKVVSLVLHANLKDVFKFVKNTGTKQDIDLARNRLKSVRDIYELLSNKKPSEAEKNLKNLLNKYMKNYSVYYSSLKEIEAYDTQERFSKNRDDALPLTSAAQIMDGKTYDAYKDFVKGRGALIRFMEAGGEAVNSPFKDKVFAAKMENKYNNLFIKIGRRLRMSEDRIKWALHKRKQLQRLKNDIKKNNLWNVDLNDITLNAKKDQAFSDFVKINDSITATWWNEKIQGEKLGIKTDYSEGIYVNHFGEMVFTIDDTDAKLNINVEDIGFNDTKTMSLEKLLSHNDLFNNYPQLKKYKVKFEHLGLDTALGIYTAGTDTITMNLDYFNGENRPRIKEVKDGGVARYYTREEFNNLSEEEKQKESEITQRFFTSVVLHEVQHAIQEIEGNFSDMYASMGEQMITDQAVLENPSTFKKYIQDNITDLNKQLAKDNHARVTKEYIEKLFKNADQFISYNDFYNSKTNKQQEIIDNMKDAFLKSQDWNMKTVAQDLYTQQSSEIAAKDTQTRYLHNQQHLPPIISSPRHVAVKLGQKNEYRLQQATEDNQTKKKKKNEFTYQERKANAAGRKNQEKVDKMWARKNNEIAYRHKDVYSVSFDKAAQDNPTNARMIEYFRSDKDIWKENKDKSDDSITFVRKDPKEHHTRVWNYSGINGIERTDKEKTKLREWYDWFKKQIITKFINDRYALYQLASKLGVQKAYDKLVVLADQSKTANTAMESGIRYRNKEGKIVRTKGLNQIIRDVGEDNQKLFNDYCIAFRVLDLLHHVERQRVAKTDGQGELIRDQYGNTLYDIKEVIKEIKQKMTPEEAQEIIDNVKKDKKIAKLFEDNRKAFVEYNHALLQATLLDSGIITQKGYDQLVANDPNFVPLSKVMDDEDCGLTSMYRASGLVDTKNPLRKIGDSIREVKNPLGEMQKRTAIYYSIAAKNKAGMTFIKEIANKEEVLANGDRVARAQGIIRKVKIKEENEKFVTQPENKDQIIYVYNNGVKEFYQVSDRDIFLALHSMDSQQWGTIGKLLDAVGHKPAALVRLTATSTPDFGLRNVIRDTFEAGLTSEHGFIPVIDSLWGMWQFYTNSEWAQEYADVVGEYGTLNRENGSDIVRVGDVIDEKYNPITNTKEFAQKQWRIFQDAGKTKQQRVDALGRMMTVTEQNGKRLVAGGKLILSPFVGVYKSNKKLNDMFEQGTRIAEYRNAKMGYNGTMDRLQRGGLLNWNAKLKDAKGSKIDAAHAAKDITLNFDQHGSWGKKLNRYIPFFNASMQGIYKMCNAIELATTGIDGHNKKNDLLKQEMRVKVALMVAAAIGVAAAGQGDEDYDEAPEWEKESFWILPNGIRIPRDQVFGKLIGHTIEKSVDQIMKGEFEPTDLFKNIVTNFAPDKVMPELLNLAIGYEGNYDTFRQKAIVPEYMADKLGYMQADVSTSNLAQHMSEAMYSLLGVNVSAKKLDWALQRHISNMSKYVLSLYDLGYRGFSPETFNERMARGYDKSDATGSLVGGLRDSVPPIANNITGTFATNRTVYKSISDFQDRYHDLKVLSSDESRMTKEEKREWKRYQDAYKKFLKFQKDLKAIKQNNKLSGTEKREKADKIFAQQIKIAKWAEQ